MAERFIIVILTVAVLLGSSAAATFNVGDSLGWTIPPTPSTYSNWVSNKTFVVGDILVYNFTNGSHDVTEVTKAAYDSCSGTNPISSVNTSPARITLATAGDHHFICAFPGHCDAGQKLSITVTTPSSPPPIVAPTSPPSSSPPTITPATPPSSSPPTITPATPPSSSPPTATPASPPSLSPRPSSGPSPSPATPKASPPTATPPPENEISPPPTDSVPSTPSPTTSPPPPNAANSLSVFSFSSVVLAIAGALIY